MVKKYMSCVGKTLKFHPSLALQQCTVSWPGSKLVYSTIIILRLYFYDPIQVCETRLITMVFLPAVLSSQNINGNYNSSE